MSSKNDCTIPLQRIPGYLPIAVDYVEHFDRVRPFFAGDFRQDGDWQQKIREVEARTYPLDRLRDILQRQNREFGAGEETRTNIARLTQGEVYFVFGGQQAGLFSGPLFTIYKILTVLKLAASLEEKFHRKVVPAFWIVADDHDFSEIDHIFTLDLENQLRRLSYPIDEPPYRQPAYRMILGPEVHQLLNQLEACTRATEFRDSILGALFLCYTPGQSFVSAFARWIMRLFRHWGLVLVDPSDPEIKALGLPVLEREVKEDSPSTQAVQHVSQRLRERGYSEQVHLQQGRLNAFYVNDSRESLVFSDDRLRIKSRNINLSKEEFLEQVRQEPQRWSPNVILRPILQDFLFPTIGVVLGPNELSYFAQLKGTYEAFGVPMPIVFPRKSVTLVERSIRRLLDKFRLSVADVFRKKEQVVSDILPQAIPSDLEQKLTQMEEAASRDWQGVIDRAKEIDLNLERTLQLARNKSLSELRFAREKILQAVRKRHEVERRQAQRIVNSLLPYGQPQERVFNIVPFLIKYGWKLIDHLYEALSLEITDHQIVDLKEL